MIYSVALICEITLYFLNSNAFYIIYDPIAQLTVRLRLTLYSQENSLFRMQAITPTLILVLAGLELTTNDVHERITRSMSKPTFRPGVVETTVALETMRFAGTDTTTTSTSPDKLGLPTIVFQEKIEKDIEAPL